MSLVVSGFDTSNFSYYGFLPHKSKRIVQIWEKIKLAQITSVIYESPHKLINTLEEINKILGDIRLCVAREITKRYEEFFRGSASK